MSSNENSERLDLELNQEITVYLHIGRHKTGTTSLQNFFGLNKTILANVGILYPSTGQDKFYMFHHDLFRDIVEKGLIVDEKLKFELIEEIIKSNCKKILISTEILSRPSMSKNELLLVKNIFKNFNLKLIVYLRRQDDFLESTYANRIRIGILSSPTGIMDIDPILNYSDFIEKYADIFGSENIIVQSYDKAREVGIYQDFMNLIGIHNLVNFAIPKRVNERYPWRFLSILRYANNNSIFRIVINNKLSLKLVQMIYVFFPTFMDKPKPLSKDEKKALFLKYSDSNRLVSIKYFKGKDLF
jgi:hypothetical protein